jgi:hypothetical protein
MHWPKALWLNILLHCVVTNAFLIPPHYLDKHKLSLAVPKPAGPVIFIPYRAAWYSRILLDPVTMKSDDEISPSSDEELKLELEVR